jgi:thiol-disulfide isomerase/thioredoxin
MPCRATVLLNPMTAGLIALAVALIAATGAGLVLRRRAGRFRPVATPGAADVPAQLRAQVRDDRALTAADLGTELGERATLVQFSTAFCAPCRPTRQILGQVAGLVPGVKHVDIDATSRLDLVRRLRIASTPTVLVLGPAGVIAKRASGLPRKADVIAAIGQLLGPGEDSPGEEIDLGAAETSTTLTANTGNVTGPESDSRSESE